MLSYTTNSIYSPWSYEDIRKYEAEGSQRDEVIYNAAHNARITLTDKNIFLCSIKQKGGKYQNFYLFAIKRNLFYYIMYAPQMEVYRDNDTQKNKTVVACLSRLGLTQKCVSSFDGDCQINDDVSVVDGTSFFIKVNANVEDFLFPKRGRITNQEVLQKYVLMNSLYKRLFKENEALMDALDKHHELVKEKAKKRFVNFVIRKGVIYGIPALFGVPHLGALFDLDSLFGLGDLADLASGISAEELINIPDSLLSSDMDDDDDIYNDTSGDHSNPSFLRKSCWEYPECKKRHLAENGTYHVVTGL